VIEALAKVDKKNSYELYLRENPEERFKELPSRFESRVIELPKVWKWVRKVLPLPPLWSHLGLAPYLQKHSPDVLFVPGHVLPRTYPKRSVVVVHDLAFDYLPYMYSWKERNYLRWSVKQAVKRAWKIVTISEKTKRDIMTLYRADDSMIHVVYPGYTKPQGDSDHTTGIGIPFGPYILFVGRLHPKKDLETLIGAFSRLLHQCSQAKGWTLAIVGSGERRYEQSLRRLVQVMGMSQWVRFVGYVPDTNLSKWYEKAEIYVQPSRYEGFGLPVIEAMAHTAAAIVSDGGALPEIVGDAGRVFGVGKQDELVEHLAALVSDSKERDKLKKKGLKRAKEFTWERCARELFAVFSLPETLL
jgi:glycosyltransferase involved in cell wall biosynthesis